MSAPTQARTFPNMSDGVEPHSDMICGHMNSDHADAVAHLVMHHARLDTLPAWTNMDTIAGDHMSISYKTEQEAATQSIVIALDPPISTVMDSRKRLVEMSKRAEDANSGVLHSREPAFDSEVLFSTVSAFSTSKFVLT